LNEPASESLAEDPANRQPTIRFSFRTAGQSGSNLDVRLASPVMSTLRSGRTSRPFAPGRQLDIT
jgi:hypothetical protein